MSEFRNALAGPTGGSSALKNFPTVSPHEFIFVLSNVLTALP
jgi:hypothetical protein